MSCFTGSKPRRHRILSPSHIATALGMSRHIKHFTCHMPLSPRGLPGDVRAFCGAVGRREGVAEADRVAGARFQCCGRSREHESGAR